MAKLDFLGEEYEITLDDDYHLIVKSGGRETIIDKTSDRYLAFYQNDYDDILDTPRALKVKELVKEGLYRKIDLGSLINLINCTEKHRGFLIIYKVLQSRGYYSDEVIDGLINVIKTDIDSKDVGVLEKYTKDDLEKILKRVSCEKNHK